MKPITLFTFGYWGWGTSTPQLVNAVDAVEKSRGFKPPIFVDTRISRSVRAPGFNGGAFGKLLGDSRYRWMKSLGNKWIVSKKGRKIQIADPSAAIELLDLAVGAAKERRRIIFFCSCPWPKWEGEINCHRTEIASLVLRASKRQEIPIEIVEWPGGEAAQIDLTLAAEAIRAIGNGRQTISRGQPKSLAKVCGLAWCSIANLHADGETVHQLVGPATWQRGQWSLPLLFSPQQSTKLAAYERESRKFRRECGLDSRRSS